jgi:hypothetical protein
MTVQGTDKDFNSFKAINLAAGTVSTDGVNKGQMDTAVAGAASPKDFKDSVRVASVANVTVSSAPAAIDGVTLSAPNADRILLKDQTTGSEKGIYIFNGTGVALTRSALPADVLNANVIVPVEEGTVNADTAWMLTTNNPIVVGTTALTFTQFGVGTVYTGTGNINVAGSVISLTGQVPVANGGTGSATAAGARTNLSAVGKFAINNTAMTANTPLTVNHALNSTDVHCQAWEIAGGKRKIDLDWAITDANNVTVTSTGAVSLNTYRFVVQG